MTDFGEGQQPWFDVQSSITKVDIKEGGTSIGDRAFDAYNNPSTDQTAPCNLTSVTIPGTVTYIGQYAFNGCGSLASVTIPENVTIVKNHAFSGCASLESVTIPNSVTELGDHAFIGCSGLESVTIGSGVASIGIRTFEDCVNLESITILNTTAPPNVAADAFNGVDLSKVSLYVPQSALDAYTDEESIWVQFANIGKTSIFGRSAQVRAVSSQPKITVKGRTLTVTGLQSSSAPVHLRLLDLRGRTVSSFNAAKSNVGTFSLTQIPAGRYLVEVRRSGVRVGSASVMVR
jgi:hypothetical protein